MRVEPLEQVMQIGAGGRLFAILTQPEHVDPERPVFVFLNSGLLHRVGPARMSVLLARKLATLGFASIRVDLSGKGDTPPAESMDYIDSVSADYHDVYAALSNRWGAVTTVIGGLCSGADNAVRLAAAHDHVVGMLLLDPMCYAGDDYAKWSAIERFTDYRRYVAKLRGILPKSKRPPTSQRTGSVAAPDQMQLRELPDAQTHRNAVQGVHERGGATLAIFTNYASVYYSREGQFADSTFAPAFAAQSREIRWRDVKHTYKRHHQMQRLIACVADWSAHFSGKPAS